MGKKEIKLRNYIMNSYFWLTVILNIICVYALNCTFSDPIYLNVDVPGDWAPLANSSIVIFLEFRRSRSTSRDLLAWKSQQTCCTNQI